MPLTFNKYFLPVDRVSSKSITYTSFAISYVIFSNYMVLFFFSLQDNEDGTLTIGYKPTEPGYYIVNLKFADNHVPGSPFTVKVGVLLFMAFFFLSLSSLFPLLLLLFALQ